MATFATGGWTAAGPALREPVGLVHWAGTETATRWSGYIDGAISSGERAAAEALERCSERSVRRRASSRRRQRYTLTRSSMPFSRRSPANDHAYVVVERLAHLLAGEHAARAGDRR